MDWILIAMRPLKNHNFKVALSSDYLNQTVFLEFGQGKDFFTLLHFLNKYSHY